MLLDNKQYKRNIAKLFTKMYKMATFWYSNVSNTTYFVHHNSIRDVTDVD